MNDSTVTHTAVLDAWSPTSTWNSIEIGKGEYVVICAKFPRSPSSVSVYSLTAHIDGNNYENNFVVRVRERRVRGHMMCLPLPRIFIFPLQRLRSLFSSNVAYWFLRQRPRSFAECCSKGFERARASGASQHGLKELATKRSRSKMGDPSSTSKELMC